MVAQFLRDSGDALLRDAGHVRRVARWLAALSSMLNYDFCPRANRWVYWIKQPLWCLLAACIASVACGLLVNPRVFLLTAVLAGIVLVGIAWPALAVRGLVCRIHCGAQRLREGRPITIRLTMVNRWPWPVWGLSLEQGFSVDNAPGAALARVPGWSTSEFEWVWVPSLRGVYPCRPPRLATGFPFGLWSASIPADVVGEVLVWPASVALSGLPDAAEPAPHPRRFTDRRAGDCGDHIGTRAFRPGDSLRRVHWTQTARQQRLIVSELQAPASTAVQVHVDLTPGLGPSSPVDESLETRIRIAASVCESLLAQHADVRCILGTTVLDLTGSGGTTRLLDALARIPRHGIRPLDRDPPSHAVAHSSFTVRITTRHDAVPTVAGACGARLLEIVVGVPATPQDGAPPSTRIELPPAATCQDVFDALRRRWRGVCHAA